MPNPNPVLHYRPGPSQYIVIFRSSSGSEVAAYRGDGSPKMTGGSGGWDVVARPRRIALTQWTGREPYRMDVPVLFDGYRHSQSVEEDIARLNQMSMGADFKPPPTVTIEGAVPIKGATWVIESIDWGDEVYWQISDQGRYYRQRQDAVVHLLQYQAEKRLKITMPKSLPNQFIVPRNGYTMKEVAKAMYGNANRWTDIKKANPKIRDPNNLKYKTVLRVP
jgi:nucleoid-associated protein YgaU